MNIVKVEWGDAWVKSGPHKISDLQCKPALTHTLGYLITETEEGVLICPERWPSDEFGLNDEGEVSYPIFIPRGMIYRVTPLVEVPFDPDV